MHNANIDVEAYRTIDARESQLWWLALLVILLLALALLAIDVVNVSGEWWFSPNLEVALNTRAMRVGLLAAIVLICAYFRDSVRRLRMENSRLVNDLTEHGRQLEKKHHEVVKLKDLSDELISLVDMAGALDLVLGMAVEMIGADTASIMLREKDSDFLRILASRGLSAEIVNSTRIRIGESIAGLVVRDGRAVILNSDDLDGEMASRASRAESIASSVLVPIHLGDQVRGVVSVAKRRGGTYFTNDDMSTLAALANQAALAIQKIELLSDLRGQVDILATTVDELRQTQAELMQSEKMASIGQLAGGIAHEINNPLQVILGRTEMLLGVEIDETKIRQLDSVLEHTTRIADIVSNLLSFSRQNAHAEYQPVDVNVVLDKTLRLLEPQMVPDDILVVRRLRDGLDYIQGNASQLQQVFTNIIMNAYQAMKMTGGTLTVTSRSNGDVIEVDIEDTGPGIPQERLDRIMEPFFTTKAEGEGTGLGLSISYGIIQSHGGSIQVRSQVAHGTCFTVSLPACSNQDEQTAAGHPAAGTRT